MRRILLFLAFGTTIFWSKAQESIFKEGNVIPPAPNATAFNKFIDVPVSHYTGVPNISVPIYTLQLPQLSLPIRLNYHAGGLKVGEHSSWVGAGWSLSAGGAINRTVRGLPDEMIASTVAGFMQYGYHRLSTQFFDANNYGIDLNAIAECIYAFPIEPPEGGIGNQHDRLAQGLWDTEPDLYHFSFPGGSGKFVFNRDRQIVKFVSDDNQFITTPLDGLPDNQNDPWVLSDKRFQIKDASGVLYTFEATETTYTNSSCGTIANPYAETNLFNVSSWQLTRMERSGNWIEFVFVDETLTYDMKYNESRSFTLTGQASAVSQYCISNTVVDGKRLSQINTSNGYVVDFLSSAGNRLDQGLTGSKSLQSIKVSKDNVQILKYDLDQSYYGLNDKLRLDEVYQVSNDAASTERLPGYQFTYKDDGGIFPKIDSYQQDYWGFFNGAADNDSYQSMVPHWKDENNHVNYNSPVSREPNLNYAWIGNIERVTYPTGGYAEFDFELNSSYEPAYDRTYEVELTSPGTAPATNHVNFSVAQATTVTRIKTGGIDDPDESFGGLDTDVKIQRCTGPNFTFCSNVDLTQTLGNRFHLPAGDYRLLGETLTGADLNFPVNLKLIYEQTEEINELPVGGLRVKRTKLYDPETTQTIQKVYEYYDGIQSSGVLFTPAWIGASTSTYTPGVLIGFPSPTACSPEVHLQTTKVVISASPSIPVGTYQGSHIGYGKVQEIRYDSPFPTVPARLSTDQKNLGVMEYEFINDQPSVILGEPYIPVEDLTHRNGKPLKQTVYKYDDTGGVGSLFPLQETDYQYSSVTTPEAVAAEGMQFKRSKDSFCYECDENLSTHHIWLRYDLRPKWHYLIRQTTKQFDENGQNPVTTFQEYGYDTPNPTHYFYTDITMDDSEGNLITSYYDRHLGNPALITGRETFRDNAKIAGERVSYLGGLPLSYSTWNRDLTGSPGVPFSTYETVKAYAYDNKSLLLESENRPNNASDINTAYLWSYDTAFVVAQISNISQSELNAKLNSIGWSRDQILGLKSTTVLRQLLTVDLNNELTEPDQFLTVYLYEDRYGLSEIHDPNGRVSYYDYDEFGRMIQVKDHDLNVLQENEYHYSNP